MYANILVSAQSRKYSWRDFVVWQRRLISRLSTGKRVLLAYSSVKAEELKEAAARKESLALKRAGPHFISQTELHPTIFQRKASKFFPPRPEYVIITNG